MKSQITITRKDNQVSISGIFSASNNAKYKNIGGKFEPDGKKWVFEDSESINKIIEDLFGLSETLVTVEIYDFEDIVEWGEEGISVGGYKIASKNGFAKPLKYYETAYLISGKTPSGASKSSVSKKLVYGKDDDSVFGLVVRKDFAERHELNIIKEHVLTVDKDALSSEKVKLLARIAEIDLLLSA